MELKYVGPKPIISHTGIKFDNNKEDKYAYLNIVVQLYKALSHEYFQDKAYKYEASTKRLSNEDLNDELKRLCPDIKTIIEEQDQETEEYIQRDLKRAQENAVLNQENKQTLENNINLMRDYFIQRAVNKTVYYCAIDALAKLIKEDRIDHIIAPMFQKFSHVLHSLQGSLRKQNRPIDTNLDIYEEDGKLLVKLQVANIV
ncbi:MAG: hypothetical protein DRG78_20585 [Epsilonproteobacteria bacterium]|nr:MAG: hypothetical protein DRG78_20585 [Campylobacterota bacterium]